LSSEVQIILAGNKCDLPFEQHALSPERAQWMAAKLGTLHVTLQVELTLFTSFAPCLLMYYFTFSMFISHRGCQCFSSVC
jgi:hypothetical protein